MMRGATMGLLGLAIAAWSAPAAAQPGQAAAAPASACVTCHQQIEGELSQPLEHWTADVHASAGLSCHDCHGGDPSPALADDAQASMDPRKGWGPGPSRLETAAFCARCHSDADYMKQFDPRARVDQLVEYRSSVHGKRNAAGDSLTATCTDCHGVHGIRPVSSPDSPVYAANVPATCARCHSDAALMAPYGIPTTQYDEYLSSVHATALLDRQDTAAPACNDCHGNHGAVPPGVESVANVCGQCHGREASLFRGSFKKELFDGMGVAECLACHDHHRVRHPTPELFHGGSAPAVSAGTVTGTMPLAADLGDLEPGTRVTLSWKSVLAPHLAPQDERYVHPVRILVGSLEAAVIDATVRPGDEAWVEPRRVAGPGLEAVLHAEFASGSPAEAGDAVAFRLEVAAAGAAPLRAVTVRDAPATGVHTVAGSACLRCHEPGDPCDVATEKMYAGLVQLDRELRQGAALLHRAETAGMEVSTAKFELKSKGTTAAVEARALIHSFDPDRLLQKTEEGKKTAAAAAEAGHAAMAELQFRRRGLGVSLILILMVIVALGLKIRQLDRDRSSG